MLLAERTRPSFGTAVAFTAAPLFVAQTQQTNPDLLPQLWNARWLMAKNADPFGYGVYHFRRTFELSAKPTSFIVDVTGDNHYQLFVNGIGVLCGASARRFESLALVLLAWADARLLCGRPRRSGGRREMSLGLGDS